MKRPRKLRPQLKIESLEARRLMASGDDFYELKSDGVLYSDAFFVTTADPVIPTIDATGRFTYDYSRNLPGDQTTELKFADDFDPMTRIKVDPRESYQFEFLGRAGEGGFAIQAFDASGNSLGELAVPYFMPAKGGLNFFDYANHHANLGPGGTKLPTGTAWIELTRPKDAAFIHFGFVKDFAFTFQSDRSVDKLTENVLLGFDPNQMYSLSAKAIQHTTDSQTPQTHTLGYFQLDADRLVIEPIHTQKYGTSLDTRLASPLRPGDTVIQLDSTEGWSNSSYDPRTRSLAWYGYRDSFGTLYPDYTYTRNVASDPAEGLWSRHGIQGNTITLNKPWSGPELAAGTPMRNAVDGQAVVGALLNNEPLVNSMQRTISGQWSGGQPIAGQVAPGTKYLQLAAIVNQSSVATDQRVSVRMQFDDSASVQIVSPVAQQRVVTLDVLANDTSGTTAITSVTGGRRGTVEISGDSRQLVYRPQPYFIGTDAFTYESVDSSGKRTVHQVKLKSLGSNLDADPVLQAGINAITQQPTAYLPDTSVPYPLVGVMNKQLNLSLNGTWRDQPQYHRLDQIGYDTGSFSLKANGDINYLPRINETYYESFAYTVGNGADEQFSVSGVSIKENEFQRDQARLNEIGLSIINQESAYRRLYYPPNLPLDASGRPFLSWRVHILPYLGFRDLYDRFRQDEPWNSANNLPLLAEMPDIFRSENDGPDAVNTRYLALANATYPSSVPMLLSNVDGRGNLTTERQVIDGLSNTLLVVQAGADKAVPWTQPVDLPFNETNPLASLGNVGPYFNAYLWDWATHALPTDMSNATFQALATPKQGDVVDPGTIFRQSLMRPDFIGDSYALTDVRQVEALKGLTLAMQNFYDNSSSRRLAPNTPAGGVNNFSWRVAILPYIEQTALYNQFRFDEPWDSAHNLAVAAQMPDIFRSVGDLPDSTTTRFRVLGGANMAYGHADALRNGPRFADFKDGLSNSILIVEAGTDKAVPWTKPDVMPVDANDFWGSMGILPDNKFLFSTADGATYFNRDTTKLSNAVMQGLATISGGDGGLTQYKLAAGDVRVAYPMQEVNKLKQIALSTHNYLDTYRVFPYNFQNIVNGSFQLSRTGLSWRVALLPFLEEVDLYNQFHFDEPWDSPHNLSLLPLMPDVFKSAGDKPGEFLTRVRRFSGPQTIDPNQKLGMASVTDGSSNTILAALVSPELAVPWTKPDDIDFVLGDDWSKVGNSHVLLTAFADGSVTNLYRDPDLGLTGWGLTRGYMSSDLETLVLRNEGRVIGGWQNERTIVVSEDVPFAFNIESELPLRLEIEEPRMAEVASRADGYLVGYGPQQRITVEGINDRNGVRQTKLFIRVPSSDPTQPDRLLQTVTLIITDIDQPPTVDPIADVVAQENSSNNSIRLTGLTAGSAEQQPLAVQARSLSPALVDNVFVNYSSGDTTATVTFDTVPRQTGNGMIEVRVIDGGPDGDLNTLSDNGVTLRTVSIAIESLNDPPEIAPIANVSLPEDSDAQLTTLTGINAGPGELQPLRVTASTNSLLLSLASTSLVLNGSTANLRWTPVANQFGQAVVQVQVEDGGMDNNLATTDDNAVTVTSFTITLVASNDAPTIDRPANQSMLEDAAELTIPLAGVSAGPYESGLLSVTATASNPDLLDQVMVIHNQESHQYELKVNAKPNASGATLITVRVEDGGADDDLATLADNLGRLSTFELVITPVNDTPELNVLDNLLVDVGASGVVVALSGISAGGGELQPLRISATSSAPGLISKPELTYDSGATSGSIRFSALGFEPGVATIDVLVEDAGLDGSFATASDNLSLTRSFVVTVNYPPVAVADRYKTKVNTPATLYVLFNDVDVADNLAPIITQAPNAAHGTAQLNLDGSIQFVPTPGFAGVATFEYQVIDRSGRSSAPVQVTVGVQRSTYENPFNTLDVNGDGQVTPLDALLVINFLNDPNHPRDENGYNGPDNLDTNGDTSFSAIDALLIINELNKK